VTTDRDPFAAPDRLGPIGAALWERSLRNAPWLIEVDLMLLEMLCSNAEMVARFRAAIAADGLYIEAARLDSTGEAIEMHLVPHPLIEPLREFREDLLATAEVLGLTPAGRARLGWPGESDPDAG